MDVRCLAFDFGGTLTARTEAPGVKEILHEWSRFHGAPADLLFEKKFQQAYDEARERYKRTGAPTSLVYMLKNALSSGNPSEEVDIVAFVNDLWRNAEDGKVYPEAVAALARLHSAGYTLFLACNTRRPLTCRKHALKEAGVYEFFSALMVSSELGYGKPDPRFYQKVIEAGRLVGCKEWEILFAGDSFERDVLGPRRHGMQAVWITENPNLDLSKEILTIPHVRDLPRLLMDLYSQDARKS